jgi:hypothetical protein
LSTAVDTLTQRDRVLGDLRAAGLRGVCSESWYKSALPNSRNYISALRAERHHIVSFTCGDDHGPNFARYLWLHGPQKTCPKCPWSPRQLELIGPPAVAAP